MLIQVPHVSGTPVWRTRMGETVHLMRNLRQWMHKQKLDQSKTLVSDYRFIRRSAQLSRPRLRTGNAD